MSIWSFFSNLFAPPAALMTRPGVNPGTTVQLRWPRSLLPLDVYIDSTDWNVGTVTEAVFWWNQQIGKKVFNYPFPPIAEVLEQFGDPQKRKFFQRSILFQTDNKMADHGVTDIAYNMKTGEMVNAIVTLPGITKRPVEVVRHEAGHVLGLDHSSEGLMVAHLPPPGVPLPLASNQLKVLRGMIG